MRATLFSLFFFFNDTATTEIYTLSLHDALPISLVSVNSTEVGPLSVTHQGQFPAVTLSFTLRAGVALGNCPWCVTERDRKSTRLNSSHQIISYAVFCLKKNKIDHVYC